MRLLGGRKKLDLRHGLRTLLMPKKGFVRLGNYFWHRVGRLKASPYNVAAGLACGIAVSWTPLIGLHILLAIGITWIVRGNILAAIIGTLIAGNPWTFPLIWLITYSAGVYFLEQSDTTSQVEGLLRVDGDVFLLSAEFFFTNLEDLIVPMFVGSAPFVIFTWIGSFAACYLAVSKYRLARNLRRRRKAEARAKSIAELGHL